MKKHLERIGRIDQLLRFKSTGTADELAEKLEISRSTLFETLSLMKDLGAEIAYCPHRQTYYYTQEGRFEIGFKPARKLSPDEMEKITGGNYLSMPLSYFPLSKSVGRFAVGLGAGAMLEVV
jgi:predicted DNA-binding transcriptional regulator YafY